MSDHQLKFKGPGFDFDAKGWQAIVAAILIVGIVAWLALAYPADAGWRVFPGRRSGTYWPHWHGSH
ncbi:MULTISPECIES: hypothetical protein [unclassified Bradyrhizobium]|uniref:hypothetical protein n=1 Tax=Bradyrhizobium sp. USDA 4541 TaxID=2817704 RepID=UPI0020A5E25E|nr:hypothetical protein [Bradyrhizobium sp. USDA 4541]MCP1854459.1 hypothetical protein [Bradyrhizobium sp. USDA 4541]